MDLDRARPASVTRLEVGLRHDGGDAETGFGLDLGGGLAAELRARGLLTPEAGGFRDRGIAGSLIWDPPPRSDRGVKLTLRQTFGASATGGVDALLSLGHGAPLQPRLAACPGAARPGDAGAQPQEPLLPEVQKPSTLHTSHPLCPPVSLAANRNVARYVVRIGNMAGFWDQPGSRAML